MTWATWVWSDQISFWSLKSVCCIFCGDVTFGPYKEATSLTISHLSSWCSIFGYHYNHQFTLAMTHPQAP